MKNLFLALVLLLTGVSSVTAQVKFGVKGGLAQSQLHGDTAEKDSFARRNSFYVGSFVEIPVKSYAIQPELLYSLSGGEVIRQGDNKETTIYLNTNNISMPVLVKLRVFAPEFEIAAGPEFTYRMSNSVIKKDRMEINKEAFNSFDLGINLGAAYYFKPHGKSFFVELRWNKNFLNILNTSNQEVKDLDLSGENKLTNSVGRLGFGYIF
ncbi:PorT family protein [Weeksellaceae bacterium TAE3-ERU29]|nr:PorT family protein [Weeksellaceae bacterium TAE3-ERU29]